MLDQHEAKVGLEVTVRKRPLVVNGVEFASRPFKGRIQSLEVPAKNRGTGCWVTDLRNGRSGFCRWDELSRRRPLPGERDKEVARVR